MIAALELPGADALINQVPHVTARSGHNPCDLTLTVHGAARASIEVGRLPVDAIVLGEDGRTIGAIHVWLTDGYLSYMEHDWFTDAPPTAYPSADRVSVALTQAAS